MWTYCGEMDREELCGPTVEKWTAKSYVDLLWKHGPRRLMYTYCGEMDRADLHGPTEEKWTVKSYVDLLWRNGPRRVMWTFCGDMDREDLYGPTVEKWTAKTYVDFCGEMDREELCGPTALAVPGSEETSRRPFVRIPLSLGRQATKQPTNKQRRACAANTAAGRQRGRTELPRGLRPFLSSCCWLVGTSNMLVYLRDGPAQTIFTCCHTETEVPDEIFYLTEAQ